jgi:alkylhydroperoxidase family enzyme
LQGGTYTAAAQAIRDGVPIADLPITPAERLLLRLLETLTKHAYRITDEQVQELRDVGWTDAQIAEAVYNGAYFNMAVRLADAFDIHPPPEREPEGTPKVIEALRTE